MKFTSIDIETTGLNCDTCQVIEFAAVIMDTDRPESEWPTFEALINPGVIVGEPYALAMHKKLLERISKGEGRSIDCVIDDFLVWHSNRNPGTTSVAGKNFSFDESFMRKHPRWGSFNKAHRFFDIGNLYWCPVVDGSQLPSTSTCMARAGLPGYVTHTALDDAMVIARLIDIHVKRAFKEAARVSETYFKPVPSRVADEPSPPPLYMHEISGDGNGVALPTLANSACGQYYDPDLDPANYGDLPEDGRAEMRPGPPPMPGPRGQASNAVIADDIPF